MGAQTTVNISDTLRNADNTLASGRLELFWPAFRTSDGFTVAPGRLSYTVTNGVVNLSLFPNAGGTPSGTSYRVDYYLTSGAGREYWVVPATGPVTIGDIRVSVAPSPAVAVGISQLPTGSTNQLFKTNTAGSAVEHAALTTGTAGTDFNVAFGSGAITMNLPDASPTSRGVVTTAAQTFAGVKTLISPVLAGTAQVGDGAGNDKVEFVEEATDPACAAGDYFIWANSTEARLRACQNGTISSMAPPQVGYDKVKGDSGTATKTGNETLKIQGTSGEISTVAADGTPDDTLTVSLPATLSTAKTVSTQWTFQQGLLFGNPADTNLYRSAANALKTDDFLEVDNFFQANAGTLLQHDPATVPTVAADTYINATANLSDMANLQAGINNIAAGVAVTNWYGTRLYAPSLGAGASLTNAYGIKVENIGVGTNRFAIQTGTGTVKFGDLTLVKNLNTVRYADQFAGADAGAKISTCLADLPAGGGTCDARGFEGSQTISATITVNKPVHLIGPGAAATFTLANGVNGNIFDITASDVLIEGFKIDGNKANQTGGNAFRSETGGLSNLTIRRNIVQPGFPF